MGIDSHLAIVHRYIIGEKISTASTEYYQSIISHYSWAG